MMEGATLSAGLADCGDVSGDVGASEAMTSYVILSRLTSANGLLLLRVFSPGLSRSGLAPGPYCLPKYMRRIFRHDAFTYTSNNAPGLEDAIGGLLSLH